MLAHVLSPTLPRRPALTLMRGDGGEYEALIARVAQARDRIAFAALFGHFGPRIKAYLIRHGAGANMAEEVTQEAMLSLWRKAHLFDPAKASAATWVFTIARNLRIDQIRRERRPQIDPDDPLSEPLAAADDTLAWAQQEPRLRAALAMLPPDQARVIELSFFSDCPHSEIAERLSIPLGTVKSRLRLAMARLRHAMRPGEGA
jgi:RNA polymerase sigma-70 factor (ECF subfamily)